ncbi:MAG: hypothetical protein A2Y56_09835 [Candidatus Aminicenantes bacterium RBG_13_63_10]|nr:MAG: hypothetical protein A2Y56_09835 [Candidatus Aminicenantes bacterium RBG_13_63_10]
MDGQVQRVRRALAGRDDVLFFRVGILSGDDDPPPRLIRRIGQDKGVAASGFGREAVDLLFRSDSLTA